MLRILGLVMALLACACNVPSQPSSLADGSVPGSLSGARTDALDSAGLDDAALDDAAEGIAAASSTTTFKFAGSVYSGGGYVPNGTKFTGSYVFNPAAKDTSADKGFGMYSMKAPYGMTITFAGRKPLSNFKGLQIETKIGNYGLYGDDYYKIRPNLQTSTEMRIVFRTKRRPGFTSDKLPLVPVTLSKTMFNGVLELEIGGKFVDGTITSLTR